MSTKEVKRNPGPKHPSTSILASIKWTFVSDLPAKHPSRVRSYLSSPRKVTNRSFVTALKPTKTHKNASQLRSSIGSLDQSKSSVSLSRTMAGKDVPQIDKQVAMWKLIQAELPELEESRQVREASANRSFEEFPMTMQVITSKANRKQELKPEKTPHVKQPSVRKPYHSAWYLPPKDWKLEGSATTQWSYIQLAKGIGVVSQEAVLLPSYPRETRRIDHR